MIITDKELLEIYTRGFNDELHRMVRERSNRRVVGIRVTGKLNKLSSRSYNLGRDDAIEISSSNPKRNKGILNKIRNINSSKK